jgi:hypothetical protein
MKLHDHPRTCMCSTCLVKAASAFGPALDLLSSKDPPKGVTTVDTTFAEPGPMEVPVEIHPSTCGIFDSPYDPLRCTCGWYFPIYRTT